MKFISFFATVALFVSGTLAAALSEEDANLRRIRAGTEAGNDDLTIRQLLKRSGCKKTSCKGDIWGSHPGLYCGDGLLGCVKGHVYQVGSDTNVCDFGTRDSCEECDKLSCP